MGNEKQIQENSVVDLNQRTLNVVNSSAQALRISSIIDWSGSDDVVVASKADMLDAISIMSSRSSFESRFVRPCGELCVAPEVDEVEDIAGGGAG